LQITDHGTVPGHSYQTAHCAGYAANLNSVAASKKPLVRPLFDRASCARAAASAKRRFRVRRIQPIQGATLLWLRSAGPRGVRIPTRWRPPVRL